MRYIDFHCDTLSRILKLEQDVNNTETLWNNTGHVDIERLSKLGTTIQCFACFVNLEEKSIGESHYHDVLEMISLLKTSINSKKVNQSTDINAITDINTLFNSDVSEAILFNTNTNMATLGCMLTIEEGGILEGDITRLHDLYNHGIRMITLTWNHENCIGYPNKNYTYKEQGLKGFGISVVKKMDELGMIIDVSHLSDGGFWDVVRYGTRPFVASHSNARSILEHPRNLTDEMITTMSEKGCVIGLNYYGPFLQENGESTFDSICKHMEHIMKIGGENILCLGSDFDGIDGVLPMEGCQDLELLVDAMRDYGFNEETIENICYKNALKFFDRYGL